MSNPHLYTGSFANDTTHTRVQKWLADPPPWRVRECAAPVKREPPSSSQDTERGRRYVCTGDEELKRVNMALLLRRPLLVTGEPGVGKSSLAYGIAASLGLGAPLRWEINSQTTLRDGLYDYDAVGHFRDKDLPASRFIRLGPLGTALLPTPRPRVLLIDELDKANYDLPNDLLHVFEEGQFDIRELLRKEASARVLVHDSVDEHDQVTIRDGRVSTWHHPVVVITSNKEREFSPAFLRRCVQFHMTGVRGDDLRKVVLAQFGERGAGFAERLGDLKDLATDVVLQTLFVESKTGLTQADILEVLKRQG